MRLFVVFELGKFEVGKVDGLDLTSSRHVMTNYTSYCTYIPLPLVRIPLV